MRWIYREFFYVPKYGKVRDKVMSAHVAVTVAVIVISLVAMSLSAYAYFSSNVSSGANLIRAASFDTVISVTNAANEPVTVAAGENGSKYVTLEAGTYLIAIEPGGTADTGFCIITVADQGTVYHTQQLGSVQSAKRSVSFYLTVLEAAVVTFTPNWGTSSYYAAYSSTGENPEQYILAGETVVLPPKEQQEDNNTVTQPEATKPAETEPEVTEPPATEPPATEPEVTEPPATEPPATEPEVTEPPTTEPPATEPVVTEPPTTEPPATEPVVTEPPATEPPATEPEVTEPPATEPPATEPEVTEPPATEPEATEPPATESPS